MENKNKNKVKILGIGLSLMIALSAGKALVERPKIVADEVFTTVVKEEDIEDKILQKNNFDNMSEIVDSKDDTPKEFLVEEREDKKLFVRKDTEAIIFDEETQEEEEVIIKQFSEVKLLGSNDKYAKVLLDNKEVFIDRNVLSDQRETIFRKVEDELRYINKNTKGFSKPNIEDQNFTELKLNEKVELLGFNEMGLAKIKYGEKILFIKTEDLSSNEIEIEKPKVKKVIKRVKKKDEETSNSKSSNNQNKKEDKSSNNKKQSSTKTIGSNGRSVPSHRNFKAYMDWRKITNKSSLQYKLQQNAYTQNGFRMYDGRYMIALGSHWGRVGEKVTIELAGGKKLNCIIGDQKADAHTDSNNMFHSTDGSFIEFIVDTDTLSPSIKKMGNASYATHENLSAPAVAIYK